DAHHPRRFHAVVGERVEELAHEEVGAGGLVATLQAAVEAERGECHGALLPVAGPGVRVRRARSVRCRGYSNLAAIWRRSPTTSSGMPGAASPGVKVTGPWSPVHGNEPWVRWRSHQTGERGSRPTVIPSN